MTTTTATEAAMRAYREARDAARQAFKATMDEAWEAYLRLGTCARTDETVDIDYLVYAATKDAARQERDERYAAAEAALNEALTDA